VTHTHTPTYTHTHTPTHTYTPTHDISKYRPIIFINTAAKVLDKVPINRTMHHIYSNNLMSKSQYGFAPQTGTVDAVMALKCFVQESINDGQYVAVILRCAIPLELVQ
jgi:hypothetical protein